MPHASVFETCASADSATPAGEAQPRVASDPSQQRAGAATDAATTQPRSGEVWRLERLELIVAFVFGYAVLGDAVSVAFGGAS